MLSKARICALRRNEYTKGAIQVRSYAECRAQ